MMVERNQVFNKFVVLDETPVKSKNRLWYSVACQCGVQCLRRLDHLTSGRTKSCKKCASKETAKNYPPPKQAQHIGELGKTFFSSIKDGAIKRGFDFNVTQQEVWDLLVIQNFKCALTGQDINLSAKIYKNNPDYRAFTASLDRIDSTKGYTKNNIQWVHKDINRLKNNYSQTMFISLCKLVSEYANQQPSILGIV